MPTIEAGTHLAKIVTCMFLGLLAVLLSATPSRAQDATAIPVTYLAQVPQSLGLSPNAIYKHYGRPAKVESPGLLSLYGVIGNHQITLIQWYDIEGGGRIGFLYIRAYVVAGFAFDNLQSTRYLSLSKFFTKIPRTAILESCIQGDAYHHMPGDEYDYGVIPLTTEVATVTKKWGTSTGGLFYSRYRLDGHVRKSYDVVSGKDQLMPPGSIEGLSLLQFAWLPLAGRNELGDIHPGPDTNFSTLTTSYRESPCYSGSNTYIK